MNAKNPDQRMYWAILVVAALLILTAWGNAYAMLAFALAGFLAALIFGGWRKYNAIAATAGCVVAAIIAYALTVV